MYEVEYVSDQHLARAAAYPGLIVYSRPMQIERRIGDRRLTPRLLDLAQASQSELQRLGQA